YSAASARLRRAPARRRTPRSLSRRSGLHADAVSRLARNTRVRRTSLPADGGRPGQAGRAAARRHAALPAHADPPGLRRTARPALRAHPADPEPGPCVLFVYAVRVARSEERRVG